MLRIFASTAPHAWSGSASIGEEITDFQSRGPLLVVMNHDVWLHARDIGSLFRKIWLVVASSEFIREKPKLITTHYSPLSDIFRCKGDTHFD